TRYHHRIKTHGSWQVRQPEPGTWRGDQPTAASTQSTSPAPIPWAILHSHKQSGAPPQTPVPRSLRGWVNHPPHSRRLLRVLSSQRDDEIGSWHALREHNSS